MKKLLLTLLCVVAAVTSAFAAKQSVHLTLPEGNVITMQMVDGQTVTAQLKVNAMLNWYSQDQTPTAVTENITFKYTAVKADYGSGANTATDVISVDANGVVTANKAGDVYVKVEIESDEYQADNTVFINVVVKAPKVEYVGTTFTAGATSSFYFASINSYQTSIFSLSDGAKETRKIDAGYYYILPTKGRDLTEVKVDGVSQKVYGYDSYFDSNYCMINVVAGKEPKEIVVTTTDEPKTAFNVTGGSVVLCDGYMHSMATLNEGTTEMAMTGTFYICPVEGTRISVVRTSDNAILTPEKYSGWEYGLVVPVLEPDIALGYNITVTEVNPNESVFFLTEGSQAQLWRCVDGSWAIEAAAEPFKPGYNYFDMSVNDWKYYEYYIVACNGQELTEVSYNGKVVTTFTPQSSPYPGNRLKLDGSTFKTPTTYTITTEKAKLRVSFKTETGSNAVLRHQDYLSNQWITDAELTSGTTKQVVLDETEIYYIFGAEGYELTKIVGADGADLTVNPAEGWTDPDAPYYSFKASQAQKSYTITAPEKKAEINPGDIATGQMVTFDFCDNTDRLDLSNANLDSGIYYFAPGKTMLGDGGAVVLEFGGSRDASYTPNEYLQIGSSSGFNGSNLKTGTMTVTFKDATSYLEKIEFEFVDGSQNFETVSTGRLLGTVWEPTEPASAPGVNVVKAGNEVKRVTFTPKVATGSWGQNNVKIKKMYVTYTGAELPTGIETVEASANEVETVYYNLQGVRVQNPANGIYVRVRGNEVDKVMLK